MMVRVCLPLSAFGELQTRTLGLCSCRAARPQLTFLCLRFTSAVMTLGQLTAVCSPEAPSEMVLFSIICEFD